jgi:hypothetical protein
MDGFLALTIICSVISIGVTVVNVMENLNPSPPKPPRPPMGKFDAIDEELTRLHNEAEDYGTPPDRIYQEITRLNNALINEKENT